MDLDFSKFKILIVDDEKLICDLLAQEFEMIGFKVFKAHSGDEAQGIIAKKNVDLVISDVRMPNGDGVSLLAKINSMGIKKPSVIMVSGFSELSKEDLIMRGANSFIEKPIDFEELLNTVEYFLKQRSLPKSKKAA